MGAIGEIYDEYTRMRKNGMDAKEVLATLRTYIERLNNQERQELAQHLRSWESGDPLTQEKPAPPSGIKPLSKRPTINTGRLTSEADIDSDTWMTCINCGKKNRSNEVFCYSCGHMLETPGTGVGDTQLFSAADEAAYSSDYFGTDSVLLLEMRDIQQYFELRPQVVDHELVVGRASENSVMVPDIDLGAYGASDLGVSRLHLGLRYEKLDKTICVFDLGSSNGTFLNGLKLYPKEIRVLRHGDEVRLGRFVLRVYYRHPGEEIQ